VSPLLALAALVVSTTFAVSLYPRAKRA